MLKAMMILGLMGLGVIAWALMNIVPAVNGLAH
jgi:hypothetical protein